MDIESSPCSARTIALCDSAALHVGDESARSAIAAIRESLSEPLRVAVAGRVKSGKSTLVNALLQHKVAPTAYGECTRTVTWFRAGYPPTAHLVFKDGAIERLPLASGQRLPESLGADPSQLDRIDVELSSGALEAMTVIDTPGLESANAEYSAATRRTLAVSAGIREIVEEDGDEISRRTEDATGKADAMVFVITGAAGEDEVEVLERFRRHLGGMRASAVNTIVVLNKSDLLGDGGVDPMTAAGERARDYAQRLGPLAAAVIPTVGLIAESLEAGIFDESHAALISRIATLDAPDRARLLDNAGWFAELESEIDQRQRQDLLEVLGLHGIRVGVELARNGATGAVELRERLAAGTGIAELREAMENLFTRRADVLKAATALVDLEIIANRVDGEDADWLMREIERTRLDPTMRALTTTWAFAHATSRDTGLPPELMSDLRRVALSGSVAEMLGKSQDSSQDVLKQAAIDGNARWRRFAVDADGGAQTQIADVMCQQYSALWQLAER